MSSPRLVFFPFMKLLTTEKEIVSLTGPSTQPSVVCGPTPTIPVHWGISRNGLTSDQGHGTTTGWIESNRLFSPSSLPVEDPNRLSRGDGRGGREWQVECRVIEFRVSRPAHRRAPHVRVHDSEVSPEFVQLYVAQKQGQWVFEDRPFPVLTSSPR